MCKCHKYNREKQNWERVLGEFSLRTGNKGDIFRFSHEDFKRQIIEIDFRNRELFAPPVENYSGLDDKDMHVFHLSFRAIFGEQ